VVIFFKVREEVVAFGGWQLVRPFSHLADLSTLLVHGEELTQLSVLLVLDPVVCRAQL
jgi:hypothetical protein